MRIVSKFTDYYDSIQGMGIDKSCVYVRQMKPSPIKIDSDIGRMLDREIDTYSSHEFYENESIEGKRIELYSFLLGYCGRLYLGYKFSHFEAEEWKKDVYFYDPREAEKYFQKKKSAYRYFSIHYAFGGYNYAYKEDIKGFSLNLGSVQLSLNPEAKALADLFQEISSPLFLYPAKAYPQNFHKELLFDPDLEHDPKYLHILVNPRLKSLDFFRSRDPYTCFQDIYQFISGVLVNRESLESNMTDLDKVNQHGFDTKYGFRKRPGAKKRRKK